MRVADHIGAVILVAVRLTFNRQHEDLFFI